MLEVVAEQTGYPADLLDLDLDLEADLGIDTVKQAEVFATIRERYGIERDDTLKLRDFPTLNHVVGVRATTARRRPRRPPPETEEPAAAAAGTGSPRASDGFPRRVPVAVLRPPLDQCVPTGVELGAGSRVVLMPDDGGVGEALTTPAGQARRRGARDRSGAPTRRRSRRRSPSGRPPARSTASTGCPRSTTRARSTTWTPPTGARRCAVRVKLLAVTMRALPRPSTLPRLRHAARRAPRLRRRRRDVGRSAAP